MGVGDSRVGAHPCTQAALIVADRHQSLQITGNGDVLEPHDGIIAIGSGSPYCLAAARALIDQPGMDALAIGEGCRRLFSWQRCCNECEIGVTLSRPRASLQLGRP